MRWRLSFRVVPILAQLIVFSAALRVTQDLVGFVDFLEFFFGGLLIFGNIGVMLVCQFAESFLDFCVARGSGNAKNVVVIFEFNWHG